MLNKIHVAKGRLQQNVTGALIISSVLFSGAVLADKSQDKSVQENIEQMTEESQQFFQNGWRAGKIETSYLFSEHLNNFDIDVRVNGKEASISGHVPSEVQKELAEEIALSVDGIETVNNQLEINPDATKSSDQKNETYLSAIEDATITAKVKTRLLSEGEVPGLKINVDTEGGKVVLQGEVESEVVKELAGKIAENTRDVEAVDNQLVVKG